MNTKRVETHQSGNQTPHLQTHRSQNEDCVLGERKPLRSRENNLKTRDRTPQARDHSTRAHDLSSQRKVVEHRSRDPTPQRRGNSNRNREQDQRNQPLRPCEPTPQRKHVEYHTRDPTMPAQNRSARNANQVQDERIWPLHSRDSTPQRKAVEHKSRDRTPQTRDNRVQSTNLPQDEKSRPLRSRDRTPQRKTLEHRSRERTPQTRDNSAQNTKLQQDEKSRSLCSRDPTPQRKVEHCSRDCTPQAEAHAARNENWTPDGRNQPMCSWDPTPQRKNMTHRNRERTLPSQDSSTRNANPAVTEGNQLLRSRDPTPQRKAVEHQSRDRIPQTRAHRVQSINLPQDEKGRPLRSRDLTPQRKAVEHQSKDWISQNGDYSIQSPNHVRDERHQPLQSHDLTLQRKDRSRDHSTRNENQVQNERNRLVSFQDHISPQITDVYQRRADAQDYSYQTHDRSPHTPRRDHTPHRKVEVWSRDRAHHLRDDSFVSRSRLLDEWDQSSPYWDRKCLRTPFHRSRDSISQSSDYSSQSRDRISDVQASHFQDHISQRTEVSRGHAHEPRHVSISDGRSRYRDLVSQSRVVTSRSRDHTPDTSISRSRDELGRVKDTQAARGRDWSPLFRAIRQKIYSRQDRGEGKSQESVSPFSGEKKSVRPGAPSEPNEYNFNYKRRGLFVIINNKNFHPDTGQQTREGTDVDAERLEERFQDLGFEVKRYDDVSRSKMSTLMYDAAAYDHSDADCFGCAILSHGLEGRVYGTDGYVTLEVLVMPFKGDKCPTLVGKPKLFFLQACRGSKMDYGVDVSDSSISSRDEDETDASSTVSIRKIPIEADFLFAYSTVPGYYSWRNNQDGSWFIQALCIVLENYGMKMELLHMLTHVNRIVAYEFASCTDREFTDKMKQMPCVVSMLTRYVYFRHKKQDIR